MSQPAPAPESGAGQGAGQGGEALTAEVGAPPVQGQPPGMGALAGVLGQGVAEAVGRVGVLAEAEVLPAGVHVAAGVHQGVAARERLPTQDPLADTLGAEPGARAVSRFSKAPAHRPHRHPGGRSRSRHPPLSAHSASGAVGRGHRGGVLTLLRGAVHLLQVPELAGGQPDTCREHSAGLFAGSLSPRPPDTSHVPALPTSPSTLWGFLGLGVGFTKGHCLVAKT